MSAEAIYLFGLLAGLSIGLFLGLVAHHSIPIVVDAVERVRRDWGS